MARIRCRGCEDLGRVNAAQLEPGVIAAVLDHLLTPERMGELLQRVRAALNDPTVGEQIAQLGREIGAKKRSIGAPVAETTRLPRRTVAVCTGVSATVRAAVVWLL